MTEFSVSEVAFLQRARRGLAPSHADRTRVFASTLTALGSDAGLAEEAIAERLQAQNGALDGLARRSLLGGAARGWLSKLLLAGLLSGVSAGVGYWLGRSHSAPAPAVSQRDVERVASVARAATPPEPRSAPSAGSAQEMPTARRSEVAASELPASTQDLAGTRSTGTHLAEPKPAASFRDELRVLRRVQRALGASNPRLALSLLDDLDRVAPRSKLLEERQAAALMAQCQLAADELAQPPVIRAFEARYPNSMYNARIRQTCAASASRAQRNE